MFLMAYQQRVMICFGYDLLQGQLIEEPKEDWDSDGCPTEEAIVPHSCPVEKLAIHGSQTKRGMCLCH